MNRGLTQSSDRPYVAPARRGLGLFVADVLHRAWNLVPKGQILPDKMWQRRHRVLVVLLWFHALALPWFAFVRGHGVLHSLLDCSLLALAAVASTARRLSRGVRSAIATLGILGSSALLVHFADGSIEAHFHYFVMLAVVSLYQDWRPFLLAVGFVLFNHGVVGAIAPASVYNHPAAIARPWMWAGIHAIFVAGACAVNIVYWRASEDRALRDGLTDLVNGQLFLDRLEQGLRRQARLSRPLAVLFVDLDGFKGVNDRFGHVAGDQLLAQAARRMAACLRSVDTAGRIGGDEFAILLEELGQADDAYPVAQRVLAALQDPFEIKSESVCVNASIGISISQGAPGGNENGAERLLHSADTAMYVAKSGGKGRIQVFDPAEHAHVLDRTELEAELETALEGGQFVLQFQPIVSLGSGGVVGLEALVRWQHPTRGLLPPSLFIPLAERTEAIRRLERWVLSEACRRVRGWQEEYEQPGLWVSVNLSARHLESDDIAGAVKATLEERQLTPECLMLEITESMLMLDAPATHAKLEALKDLGVRLALDDFGTRYSSLSYLRRFPIDVIKIDREFVQGVDQRVEDGALARAIIQIGETLGLKTVVEGIEGEEQWKRVQEYGCSLGQGFYMSRPLDPEGVDDFLHSASLAGPPREARDWELIDCA